MKQKFWNWYGDLRWRTECKINGVTCWFWLHQERMGSRENYEDDWCARCYCNDEHFERVLPNYLNSIFVKVIELFDNEWGEDIGNAILDFELGKLKWFRLWWEY